MLKHLLSKSASFQADKYLAPSPVGAVVSREFQFDCSSVYRVFPYLKFKVNASLGQIQGVSLSLICFSQRSLEGSFLPGANGEAIQFFNNPRDGKPLQAHSILLLGLGESCNGLCVKEKRKCANVSTSFQSFCQQEMLPAALRSQEVSKAVAGI